ncbi:hypothetical protein [Croceitalea rosinachiae]|uniref:Uncharacterized protein n=1 Tax=Croceitalea rosinachiae TaxID=3075596 RepID=A0ABU3A6H8_9FLAO|nr:hypothetical protein [Croceitalea sp. F388]MDT0605435.1 hypothetical protein [Croceitalea sp. F388]
MNSNMNKQLHMAAQYLAMAGKSFLDAKDDDSHTNLGFFIEDHSLRTWHLDESGTYLAFSFDHFTLQWGTADSKISFALEGKTHKEIVSWISKMAIASKLDKPYNYSLHYELPYTLSDDFRFELSNSEELNQLLLLRILAQKVLEGFLSSEKLKSDIRIWPHHLDTGAFVVINDSSGKSIGMGMAIPDTMVNDHYFYISVYKGHDGLATDSFSKLTYGEWKNEGFKGAVLNTTGTMESKTIQFFQEAYKAYINQG